MPQEPDKTEVDSALLEKEVAYERAEDYIEEVSAGQISSVPVIRQLVIALGVLMAVFGTSYIGTVIALFEKPLDKNELVVEARLKTPTTVPVVKNAFAGVEIIGKAAFVWDVKNQRALFNKNGEEALPLASVTKLMTALIAHELLEENAAINISRTAIREEGDSGFHEGELFSTRNLTDLTLLSSSNDGARALAMQAGNVLLEAKDTTHTFVRAMNIRADELGLTETRFNNPTGLDISPTQAGGYGSARDMAFLMEYIIAHYPDVVALTQADLTTIYNEEGAYHIVKNTNESVTKIPGLIASKTGYTELAGGNLVIAFDAGLNRPIVIAVLGSTRSGRFNDMLRLSSLAREQVTQE